MKKYYLFFLLISFLVSSCKDDYSEHIVHFHGTIILKCDSTRVSNASVQISRRYDTGSQQIEDIGQTTTNNNGYYSLTASVPKDGVLTGYYFAGGTNNIGFAELNNNVDENTSDVLTDMLADYESTITCHIKNVSPYNSNDVFHGLWVKVDLDPTTGVGYYSYVNNLYGTSVDTTVTFSLSHNQQRLLRYSYTKGVSTAIKYDTIAGGCHGPVTLDIFY